MHDSCFSGSFLACTSTVAGVEEGYGPDVQDAVVAGKDKLERREARALVWGTGPRQCQIGYTCVVAV